MKKFIFIPIITILMAVVRQLSSAFGKICLLELCAEALENDGDFITYHFRPKMASDVYIRSDQIAAAKSLAIVMQGAIVDKCSFTLETLKIYKQHSPDAKLILSTWESETPAVIRKFESLGVEVVLNKKPAYAGNQNINLQITSSQSGVLAAQAAGSEYVLKTRTDQRIYAPNVSEFLYNLSETFPVSKHFPKQRKRIIGCGLNTFKYRMYGLSDMLIYGHIEDMKAYWAVSPDNRVLTDIQIQLSKTSLREFAELRLCEVYLATEFLGKMGRDLTWTLRDSWESFSDHFCVVDKEQLDLYWPKYSHSEYRWLNYADNHGQSAELSFREWLNMHTNLKNKNVPEDILDSAINY